MVYPTFVLFKNFEGLGGVFSKAPPFGHRAWNLPFFSSHKRSESSASSLATTSFRFNAILVFHVLNLFINNPLLKDTILLPLSLISP